MPAPTPNTSIDTVNEHDEKIGTVLRREALERGKNFRTAHVFVLDRERRILLQRLAPQRERHPGRWGSSVAAYLFAGESYEEAAIRRMGEELGVEAPLRFLGKIEMRDLDSRKFVELFLARSGNAAVKEPDHVAQVRYWPVAEVRTRLAERPADFTPTFARLFRAFNDKLQ